MAPAKYLSVQQVAARYACSVDTIWRWKRDGVFPLGVRFSPGCTRWRIADLEEWEQTRATALVTHLGMPRSRAVAA